MGLHIHAVAELPLEAKRGYYMYLLDYGWGTRISNVLLDNFTKLSEFASQNDAVIIRGIPGHHFEDEVLSWHHVNGVPGDQILPAIMITTCHPREFPRNDPVDFTPSRIAFSDNMVLIPLGACCKDESDVVELIGRLMMDIKARRTLNEFEIAKSISRQSGGYRRFVDALILQPNMGGLGVDLKKIIDCFRK